MKISLCIPMYNESAVIANTARTVSSYMQTHFDDYEIIFCDDGSHDGCGDIVRTLALPNTNVIGDGQNRGKGYAVRSAMLYATGDVRIFTDADLAYGTDVIGRLVETFEASPKADLIVGSRNISRDGYEGYTWTRRIASRAYIRLLSLVGGFRLSDSQCGCKAFRGEAAEAIFSKCETDGFAFDFEALLWAIQLNKTIQEMSVKVINHGGSKVRLVRESIRMLRDLRIIKKKIKKAAKD